MPACLRDPQSNVTHSCSVHQDGHLPSNHAQILQQSCPRCQVIACAQMILSYLHACISSTHPAHSHLILKRHAHHKANELLRSMLCHSHVLHKPESTVEGLSTALYSPVSFWDAGHANLLYIMDECGVLNARLHEEPDGMRLR